MEYKGPAIRSPGGAGTPRVPGTVHSGDPASRSVRANNAIGRDKQKIWFPMVENITKRQVGLQSFSFRKRCSSRVLIAQCALAVDLALHRRLGGRRILHRVDLVQARHSYPSAALHRGGIDLPSPPGQEPGMELFGAPNRRVPLSSSLDLPEGHPNIGMALPRSITSRFLWCETTLAHWRPPLPSGQWPQPTTLPCF